MPHHERAKAQSSRERTTGPGAIRAISVEDHEFVGEWLSLRLAEAGIEHVANVTDPADLIPEAERLGANRAIIDVTIPGADPFSAAADLARSESGVRVVFLSASVSRHHIVAAIRAGAVGYFCKSDDPAEIMAGLRDVASGRLAFSTSVVESCPSLAEMQGEPLQARERLSLEGDSRVDSLTPREREVLALMGQGLSRAEIAKALHRSAKTIDKHRASLMEKLDIHDRAQLVLFAVREGIVDPQQQH